MYKRVTTRILLKRVLFQLGIKSAEPSIFDDVIATMMTDFGRPDTMYLSPQMYDDLKKLTDD